MSAQYNDWAHAQGQTAASWTARGFGQHNARLQDLCGSAQSQGWDQTQVRFIGFSDRPPRMVACRVPVFRVKAGSRRYP